MTEEKNQKITKKILTFEDIIFKSPLYKHINFDKIDIDSIQKYIDSEDYQIYQNRLSTIAMSMAFGGGNKSDPYEENISTLFGFLTYAKGSTIDCYCKKCGKEKTFISIESENEKNDIEKDIFNLTFNCITCKEENLYFSFKKDGHNLIKIGEHPSKYDLGKNETGKYRKILGDKYDEYNKAIIVHSLGFSIAGFTYLRRIVENFLFEIFTENESSIGISLSDFKKEIKENQLKLLKPYLPEWINKNNKMIYSILSVHMHTLTEDSAEGYFPLMKRSIDLILDKRIEELRHKKESDEVDREISIAHSILKGK